MKGFLNNWDFKELIFQQDEKIGKDLQKITLILLMFFKAEKANIYL